MHKKNRYMRLISWIHPRGSETVQYHSLLLETAPIVYTRYDTVLARESTR